MEGEGGGDVNGVEEWGGRGGSCVSCDKGVWSPTPDMGRHPGRHLTASHYLTSSCSTLLPSPPPPPLPSTPQNMSMQERFELAERTKSKGNDLFKAKKFGYAR